ncbi:MAG: pyridoxal phosphate-dependent aminotransferase, partial [Clostridia bacterium]
RDAIIAKLQRDNGLAYERSQIIVSNGAKHSLYTAFQTLLDPGDEVLIPTPCWVSYPEMVRMAGGTPVFVESMEEENFVPSMKAIAAAVTAKTKVFMLTTPSNPNGCVWPEAELRALAELAVEKDFYILSDEIYEKLIYDGKKHVSVASFGEAVKERTILVNGVSKSYAMTGFRIGYAAGPKAVIQAMSNYQSQATSAPNTGAQHAATVALNMPQQCVEDMRRAFEERRNELCRLINSVDGLSCLVPQGAFYTMMNMKALIGKRYGDTVITGSADFANALVEHAHVAVVPGNAFMAEGYCRLSYATSMQNIHEAVRRIALFIKELK